MELQFHISDRPDCLGHHFIVGLSGAALADSDRSLLETLRPAGVLLRAPNFRENVEYSLWLSSLKAMLQEIQTIIEREKFIVTIDHEGGRIHRVPAPLTRFPDAMSYARRSGEVGEAMGLELSSIGVNLSLGPVVDIHSNPHNPVIGRRAFGNTAEAVISAAIPFVEGLARHNVLACAKHFPGHGDTSQDSHLELPRLKLGRKEIFERELKPFQALINAGIPMILTAHVKFLEIDRRNPATLSRKILSEILRKEMNFRGVILSDDLDMQAIADNYSEEVIAERALSAGLEMFLFNHKPARGIELARALLKSLRREKTLERKLEDAYGRIRELIEGKLSMNPVRLLDNSELKHHAKLANSF